MPPLAEPRGRLTIEEVAARIAELPAMPANLAEVIAACDDAEITVGQLAQRILHDQHLTASILKLANSSFYGLARRITTVTEAVGLLGFSTIKSLAISSHTYRLLNRALPGYDMDRGEIWRHSVSVAMVARKLAVEVRLTPVEEAFVAGLLHDIGKTVLSGYLEDSFREVLDTVQVRGISFADAEQEILGFDHAELGAHVAVAWNFPPALVEAIRLHHRPQDATQKPRLTAVVHVADALCMMAGIGLGCDGLQYPLQLSALETIGLVGSRVEALLDEIQPLLDAGDFSL